MIQATLVLEGGGTRGVFTAGILDYLMENDIWVSHVVGVSAGACNAMNYLSGQIGRTKECFIPNDKNDSFLNSPIQAIRNKELMNMERAFYDMPYITIPFDFEKYFNSKINCEIVTTNLETGNAEYMDERENEARLLNIVKASCSIPFASKIAYVDNEPYLDGGIADSIPICRAMTYENEKIIVVRTRNKEYRKSQVTKGVVKLYKRIYKDYPNAVKTMVFRNKRYNEVVDVLNALEALGKVFVINPKIEEPGRLEKDSAKLMEFYDHGYLQMKDKFDDLVEYLGV